MNGLLIEYTGTEPSFTTVELITDDKHTATLQTYIFGLQIEEQENDDFKYRVSVFDRHGKFLTSVYCDELEINKYICNDEGETITRTTEVLK